ncbi:hypothetical protein NC652_041445 [Populus alba x Populus x berolinensis]|nr:hypothetical protein NC652_041445 [Populus alba x Populus x berolinensis]
MKPQNLLFSLFLFFTVTTAQTTIQPGTTLSAANPDQKWWSPTNTFYVGFSQVGSSSSYTLTINYNGGVPIWTAGNGTTTVDSKGSFHFLSSGNLRLLNGSGAVVWDSNTARLGATTASLDDFGNLVLKNGTSVVWSSFDHPTDTIVPNQTFSVDQVLRSGSYSFRFLRTGNLTLRWNDTIEYWNKGLNSSVDGNLTSPTLGLQRTGGLTIFDAALPSGSNIVAYSNDYDEGGNRSRFLRLGKDGNFRMYSTDIGRGNTTMVWSALTDQCQDVDMQQVTRAIQVSFWCIQDQPSQRPKMGKIENPPAPKATTEGSIPGTSILSSSNVSALSTFATSAPTPSSSSSFQTLGLSPLASGRNIERASSALLHSDAN